LLACTVRLTVLRKAPAAAFGVEKGMKTVLCLVTLLLAGCSSAYYGAMEKFGFAKREILVDRVEKTRDAQNEAKEQFASALEQFLAVTKVDGGELQRKYDSLNREFQRSETRAQEVRDRIAAVEDVADALFDEWKSELKQYSNASLRRESERELDLTRRRYDELMRVMKRAADRMDPVLATFRDQVLFLKHNLNARALASLTITNRELEADISRLVADMEASIREAEDFIKTLREDSGSR
jgi:Skp family chaperone for outer membrane proteins